MRQRLIPSQADNRFPPCNGGGVQDLQNLYAGPYAGFGITAVEARRAFSILWVFQQTCLPLLSRVFDKEPHTIMLHSFILRRIMPGICFQCKAHLGVLVQRPVSRQWCRISQLRRGGYKRVPQQRLHSALLRNFERNFKKKKKVSFWVPAMRRN